MAEIIDQITQKAIRVSITLEEMQRLLSTADSFCFPDLDGTTLTRVSGAGGDASKVHLTFESVTHE